MTNEEKIKQIIANSKTIQEMPSLIQSIIGEEMLALVKWKDEQYKEEFNVPDYIKLFEDITNYIGNDVYAAGYNKARERYRRKFKEYLEKKKEKFKKERDILTNLNARSLAIERLHYLDILNEIINEFFKED